jgi:hypothetical protein
VVAGSRGEEEEVEDNGRCSTAPREGTAEEGSGKKKGCRRGFRHARKTTEHTTCRGISASILRRVEWGFNFARLCQQRCCATDTKHWGGGCELWLASKAVRRTGEVSLTGRDGEEQRANTHVDGLV